MSMIRRTIRRTITGLTIFMVATIATSLHAALLGVSPGNPDIFFNFDGSDIVSYTAGSGALSIKATPQNVRFRAGEPPISMSDDSTLVINATLDASGNMIGGTMTLSGTVTDVLGDSTTYSGTLVTCTTTKAGTVVVGPTTGAMDFRCTGPSGTMSGLFSGMDIGIIVNMENSTFTGSFTENFNGRPKGNVGPIDPEGPSDGPGTGTIGFWKTHPEAWPVEEITIGGITYPKEDAVSLLKTPGKGNKALDLAKQLIAAKLNVLNGNDDSCISDTIVAADDWLVQYPIVPGVSAKDSAWDIGGPLKDDLDEYNNGNLSCADHRG